MATIEFGPGLTNNFAERLWGGFQGSGDIYYRAMVPIFAYAYGFNGYGSNSWFDIYKGTVPTDFSELTSESSRSSDRLIRIPHCVAGAPTTNFAPLSNASVDPVLFNSVFFIATASGTATWFRMLSSYYWGGDPFNQIVGTIGLPDSGADLQISNTDIVSGRYYKIYNLKISIPLNTITV